MCAFGGKADIALTCRSVSNMAQRHFLLALTMATDAAAVSQIRRSLHPEYHSTALGRLLARMRGLPVVLNCKELKVDSPVGLSRRKQ